MARRGGRRAGAGRPAGSGRYHGEETRVMRVPTSLVDSMLAQLQEYSRGTHAQAGRQGARGRRSSAQGIELNLVREMATSALEGGVAGDGPCDPLSPDPGSTFVYTVRGDAMDRAGILDGDRVLVDRRLKPAPGDIVLAVLEHQDLTVHRFMARRRTALLEPDSTNSEHRSRPLQPDRGDSIWGVVTGVVRQFGNYRFPDRRS